MMLIYLGLFVVLITLYSDVNPCSQIPFSGPQSKIAVTKSAYKMIVVLFYNLDYKGDYVAYFIGFCAASALLLLAYRYKRIIYYRKSVNTFSAIMDVALAWGYVCVLIHIVFNDGNSKIGLVYMVLLSPFACLAYLFILDKRKFHVIKSNAKGLKKDEDVEIFVNVVLELIEKSDTDSNKIKLEGMLKNYQKNGVADGQELQIIKELTDDGPMGEDNTDKLSAWYRLLRSIIEQSLKKFTKSPRLRLLLAYLQHENDIVLEYADHHDFSAGDIENIKKQAENKPIITTEKDYVRLKNHIPPTQLFYLPIKTTFVTGQDQFDQTILHYVGTSTTDR